MNRESGEFERNEDGGLAIQFGPKLETACTVPVSEEMVVRGFTDEVASARKDIIEFLLTSHPLDCPVCDKGGECPLQNLTMEYGSGKSRFLYDEKKHLGKHVPLGELIFLDQERCIQCGRCVRFQDELVDDAVIGFEQRGRSLQIVSYSEPGFDSYFSGNTTDICPVGALTTSDFRFGARPWEMKSAASLCTHCPVGCNLTLNVRRDHKSGGGFVVKRVLPRQNECVNEIWICDKGRFGHHYASSGDRLTQPLVKVEGELQPATWDEALDLVAENLKEAGEDLRTLVSGRISNEDLFNIGSLTRSLGGKNTLYSEMAGGDLVSKIGVGQGTNLSVVGAGTTILVVASDLEEEAPIYWLRVKQAAERGAKVIVANPRPTKLERYATHVLRYPYGSEAELVLAMINSLSAKRLDMSETEFDSARVKSIQEAAQDFAQADNAIIFFGSEGTSLESGQHLAQACANLLIITDHIGKANNGLIGVWERANTQGAWDMGFQPDEDLEGTLRSSKALYVVASDPAGDDPALVEALESVEFLVVQELFLTDTAKLADVVLPAQAFIEREGSLTNGERRVQRFYSAVPKIGQTLPDFSIAARIGSKLSIDLEGNLAGRVMEQIAAQLPDYSPVSYREISAVVEQWPDMSRDDLYFGGTSYENTQGLGYQLQPTSQRGEQVTLHAIKPSGKVSDGKVDLLAVPVTKLYDRGITLMPAELLHQRIPTPYVILHPQTASPMEITDGMHLHLSLSEDGIPVLAQLDETIPEDVILVPRSMGVPIHGPTAVQVEIVERAVA
jgi:NADH-quinone oxidoreductase subunit G